MTTTLRTLLDRVEKGEGADRYVDACLELMLTPELGEAPWTQPSIGKWVDGTCADNIVYAPAYTSSIDAAVALVEKVLAEYDQEVSRDRGDRLVTVYIAKPIGGSVLSGYIGQHAEEPRATLIALLRAKIAQEEGA